MSIRECDRCTATTAAGHRCKLRTCKVGPYCWIHTKSIAGLQVKRSGIPGAGLGLYTTRERKKGDKRVVMYGGTRKNKAQIDAMRNTDYVFEVKKNSYIDGAKTNSSPARYINHCRSVDEKKKVCENNAKFYRSGNHINLQTKKRIPAGDEIFASYGSNYWKKKKKTLNTKKKKK